VRRLLIYVGVLAALTVIALMLWVMYLAGAA
jgi:hypothetical protein